MVKYSIIIPVYNRPVEVEELLSSLSEQTYTEFEVLIVEDGSKRTCESVVKDYRSKIRVKYFQKENTGQGFSRNFGSEKAEGSWLIFFDSDCVIPPGYLSNLDRIIDEYPDTHAYCGPDGAGKDFSPLQKAISYSMTSFLTTGGIRGSKIKVDQEAHLRSYNLVIEKAVFDELGGFKKTNMGEDMELSHRFRNAGYKALISDKLLVFHKRRNTLPSFYRQVFSFGRTRIQLKVDYGIPIKLPHIFPSLFSMGFLSGALMLAFDVKYSHLIVAAYLVYFLAILIHSSIKEKSILVGILAVITSFYQHLAYGLGFLKEAITYRKS
jgi:glycosyltransferase involved in cell wall biosynthesis